MMMHRVSLPYTTLAAAVVAVAAAVAVAAVAVAISVQGAAAIHLKKREGWGRPEWQERTAGETAAAVVLTAAPNALI